MGELLSESTKISETCRDFISKLEDWSNQKKSIHSQLSDKTRLTEIKSKHAHLLQTLSTLQQKKQQVQELYERKKQEKQTFMKSVDVLQEERSSRSITLERLTQRKQQLSQTIKEKQVALEGIKRDKHALTLISAPKWEAYNQYLGFDVAPIREDILKFSFTLISERDWNCEYYFIVDMSEKEYRVAECEPMLTELSTMVGWLNETRDFYSFIKMIRSAFVQHSKYKM